MTIQEIKKMLKGSGKKHIIIGVCILLFGSMFIFGAIFGIDKAATNRINNAVIVMGSIFALVGFFMMARSIKIRVSVNNESHPLIKAINNYDSEALIWAHALVFKMNANVTELTNWNLLLYFKDGARSHVEIKNEAAYTKLRAYLSDTFPNAELDYNETIKAKMKEDYGIK